MKAFDPLPALCVLLEHALPLQATGVGSEEAMTMLVAAGRLGATCKTLHHATEGHTEYVRVHRALNEAAKTADLAGIERAIAEGAHPNGFRVTVPPSFQRAPILAGRGAIHAAPPGVSWPR